MLADVDATSSSAATRTCSSTGAAERARVVNAGSVGMPYEGRPGAYWALLGPEVELRRTEYDVEAAVARDSRVGAPRRRAAGRATSLEPPSPEEVDAFEFETPSVARSYVREARRRGSARGGSGSARSSSGSPRSTPTPRSRCASAPTRAARLGDALRADDRRERQPRHRALFVKYRRPEDYLAVPLEELERDIFATGFFRQKAKSIRGTMRMLLEEFDGEVPRRIDELVPLPGVARKTANVVAAELGDAQGIVVDTHVRRLSQRLGLTRQEDPGQDRARPAADRAARRLGALPAPADLARPARVRRAAPALRGLRAQRPVPVEPRRRRRSACSAIGASDAPGWTSASASVSHARSGRRAAAATRREVGLVLPRRAASPCRADDLGRAVRDAVVVCPITRPRRRRSRASRRQTHVSPSHGSRKTSIRQAPVAGSRTHD